MGPGPLHVAEGSDQCQARLVLHVEEAAPLDGGECALSASFGIHESHCEFEFFIDG